MTISPCPATTLLIAVMLHGCAVGLQSQARELGQREPDGGLLLGLVGFHLGTCQAANQARLLPGGQGGDEAASLPSVRAQIDSEGQVFFPRSELERLVKESPGPSWAGQTFSLLVPLHRPVVFTVHRSDRLVVARVLIRPRRGGTRLDDPCLNDADAPWDAVDFQ